MAIARYEYTEGSSSKFWQIELSGAAFTTTHGKIGSTGQTLRKAWPDAASAKREHDKLIAQKTKKGYTLVSKPAPASKGKPAPGKKPARVAIPLASGAYNAALAKVIDADPTDDGAWSVYADWLQAQGDPRGELAAVQERLRAQPKDKALLAAEKKLLKDHAAQLVGDIAVFMTRAGKLEIPGVTTRPDLEPEFRETWTTRRRPSGCSGRAVTLPTAKIVKQLHTLDLSGSTLNDAEVHTLAAYTGVFSHLKRIDLSNNFISKRAAAAAASLAPAVRTKPQRVADEYDGEVHRYAAVGE